MKVAIITDTHAGVRGDNPIFLDNQELFYRDVFFPELKKRNIDTVLHLGDVFDKRRGINFVTLKRVREMFFDPLKEQNIEVHVVAGNHDVFFKNTNDTNSLSLLMKEYKNWNVYHNDPKEITLGSCAILLSPWITKDNYKLSMDTFQKTKSSVLMGHFEFQGFEMIRGSICDHGLDKKDFSKFDSIYSGHFHHPSENGNVKYLGAPFEMDWSDCDGKRGFHIFDTETRALTFIQNPYKLHHKIEYDDEDMTVEDISNIDVAPLQNTFVKLIVKNKTNQYIFDLLGEKIADGGCADLKTIEDTLNIENISEDEIIDETKDTKHILHSYVDGIETNVDRKQVKNIIDELYAEAMSL
jgi:DNA repair exonuclease SbcCD nuclease subunit